MIDYKNLSDEDFSAHCAALYAEQDRRAKMNSIPAEVKKLSQDFESLGGNKEELITKINEPKEVEDNETTTDSTSPADS